MGSAWLARVVLLRRCTLAGRGGARARRRPGGDGFLAETGFDFWASDDAPAPAARSAGTRTSAIPGSSSSGARVGGERLQFEGVDVTPATLGGFVGVSHAVGRIWPTVTLGVDLPFREGDTVDLETTGTVGARWFLTGRGSSSYAIHLGGFRTEWEGASGAPQPQRAMACSPACTRAGSPRPPGGAWGPRALRDSGGRWTREVELLPRGQPGRFLGGLALDSFSATRADRCRARAPARCAWTIPPNDLTACGWAGELRAEWHFGVRERPGSSRSAGCHWSGCPAGAIAGPAHTYYDYEGRSWAGVRWQPARWPLSVHVAAVGRRLVAGGRLRGPHRGGLQMGLSFR